MAWLDRVTDTGEAGNGSILASHRLPAVLALAVAVPPPRTTEDQRRDSPVDSSHEDGQPKLGAPRIHGELLHLGFTISEPTVSRYLRRLKRHYDEGKAKHWAAFLNNHREVIAAFDFFTVPTLTFRVLYCLFVIEHGRRRILHFNTTAHPTSEWIVQQLREAFPLPCPQRYVVLDRDAKFGSDVIEFLKASGIKPIRTSIRSPWQNGIAERWIEKLSPGDDGSRNPAE